jgi:rod shape determining protein RodA
MLILLVLPLLVGTNVRGANRWLDMGFFRVQSSELAKPLLILFFAGFWEEKIFHVKKIMAGVFFLSLPCGLILLQPDLGSAIIFFLIWLGMIFAAGVPWRWLVSGVVVMILIFPLFGWVARLSGTFG